jgi:hypothetical protein
MKLSELRKVIPPTREVIPIRVGGFTCDAPRFEALVEDEETGLVVRNEIDRDFEARWLRPSLG